MCAVHWCLLIVWIYMGSKMFDKMAIRWPYCIVVVAIFLSTTLSIVTILLLAISWLIDLTDSGSDLQRCIFTRHHSSCIVTPRLPLASQDIGKCQFLKMRWESHTSSSSGWQLWLHFRTLIDRFNSFLETEGHSDHRKPMWTVNLVTQLRYFSQSAIPWSA